MGGSGQNCGKSNQSQQRGECGRNTGRERLEETYEVKERGGVDDVG